MYRTTRNSLTASFFSLYLISTVNAGQIDVTGYASLIGTKIDVQDVTYWNEYAKNYIDYTHQSRIGLQFNTDIINDLEFSLTLLGEGNKEYLARTAWFYGTYIISKNTSIRFGRLKVPVLMVSNYIDIGHAYPWISPPPEVYSLNMIESSDGLEYIHETDIFNSTLLLNTYIGSDQNKHYLSPSFIIDSDVNKAFKYKAGDKINFESHELFGFELSLATNNITFKIAGNQAIIASNELNITKARMSLNSIGLILDINNFVLYSELVYRETDAALQPIFPDQKSKYITFGYRISKFLPYFTVATIAKGKRKSKYAVKQQSTSFGVRYDVNSKMDIKFQASKIKPGFDNGDIGRYGLFDQVIARNRQLNVFSMSVDILF